ncbi:hypothetical protein TNIN_129681 [Trichonephila inaurata madagascariensis]|uniref:Uncharacterized protein n=1 Tax=Trichonephila inaurata madagascariensis TaxID=2747483 RepID=A0A8X6YIA9_9ARAC|nr:hypothetical protein TNIN_129681 [Trichonephila inaurata madagascariensis]
MGGILEILEYYSCVSGRVIILLHQLPETSIRTLKQLSKRARHSTFVRILKSGDENLTNEDGSQAGDGCGQRSPTSIVE